MPEDQTSNDWDHLSDQEWNEQLDRKIAEFNAGRGELKLPVPIMTSWTTNTNAAS